MNTETVETTATATPLPDSATLSTKDAAKFIGISTSWLYRNWRKVPHIKLGRRVRFTREGLRAWFTEQERANVVGH